MNSLIERIEFLKKVGADAITTYPSITNVTLEVIHDNVDEIVEAAKHYQRVAEPLSSTKRLWFSVYEAGMKITISVLSKTAVNVSTTYTIN